jgi:hypothetical protein
MSDDPYNNQMNTIHANYSNGSEYLEGKKEFLKF